MTFDLSAVSPHTLKHTSVCRFIARGGRLEDAISYFATGARTLETVYRKRSQEHPKGARAVWENAARESMLTGFWNDSKRTHLGDRSASNQNAKNTVFSGAGDEIRTHDPNLGKVVLYH